MIELIDRITAFYGEIDQLVFQFQLNTGLRCVEHCGGVCCKKEDVHTTVAEMLPIAHTLLIQGESSLHLEQIESLPSGSRCTFYVEEGIPPFAGHCAQYALRPMICRMFGFAAARNKMGDPRLSTCKLIKQADPRTVAYAEGMQSRAPCFSDLSARLYGLDPSFHSRLLPINEALKRAISRMGLYLRLSHGEDLGGVSVA